MIKLRQFVCLFEALNGFFCKLINFRYIFCRFQFHAVIAFYARNRIFIIRILYIIPSINKVDITTLTNLTELRCIWNQLTLWNVLVCLIIYDFVQIFLFILISNNQNLKIFKNSKKVTKLGWTVDHYLWLPLTSIVSC